MSFQANVRATFEWPRFVKVASAVALAVTFFTSIWITREPDPVGAYVLFFVASILVGVVYFMTSKTRMNIFDTPAFSMANIARPIGFGLLIVLAAYVVLFLAFRFPLAPGDARTKAENTIFWAILVGFVEEFVRWVWLQTTPFSVIVGNLLWVLMHPAVAVVFSGGTPNWFFATFALGFGLLMTLVMWLYETPMAFGLNAFLGPVLAMTLHAGHNALAVIWKVQVAVPGIGPVVLVPMYAPAVVACGLAVLVLMGVRKWRSRNV